MHRSGLGLVLAAAALATTACSATPASVATPDGGLPDSAVDSASGGLLGFTPSNVDLSGMDLSNVGDFVVSETNCTIASGELLASCGDGASVLAYKLATQTDGSKVGVYVARSIRIEAAAQLTVEGNYPVVLVALDQISILGRLIAAGKADTAVGGGATQTASNTKGGGPGGGGAGSTSSAAGGGSYCGLGGAGAVESGNPAPGGTAYGTAALSPLVGGSGGGDGNGNGGAGGGALQLVAKNSVTVAAGGSIHVGGGGGEFGGAALTQEAAGGGSGGAILLEAAAVTVAGTLAANGGGGGEGALGNAGADASGDDQPALGGNDVTKGSNGGNGSAGASVDGTAGAVMAGFTAGAGGGGAGRIRINTKSGAAILTAATLSPATSTPCATQGTLH